MPEIRKATGKEMLDVWERGNVDSNAQTARFFCQNIESGNAEFWTIDDNGQLLGELYVFHKLEDEMRSAGIKRATIGVDETEKANIRLYSRLGFGEKIKDCYEDPCAMNEKMQCEKCSCFWLLQKNLI